MQGSGRTRRRFAKNGTPLKARHYPRQYPEHKQFRIAAAMPLPVFARPPIVLRRGLYLLIAVLALAPLAPATAQPDEKRISALSPLDRQYMDQQRQLINELTLANYGGRCCRREADLDYLQRLLDDRIVREDQVQELQAMGVLMGDLLAEELDLHWVVYEDAKGRSRALQLDETDNFLFPVTMISRRRQAGDTTPVIEIYQRAVDALEAARPPLPFQ
jgi:hypothetical protein